jgi:hypothetical protein
LLLSNRPGSPGRATLDLAEAAKAHELPESGSITGKIALTV